MIDRNQNWFDAKLDWAKVATILSVLGTLSYFMVSTWTDNKTQLAETRAAIVMLGQKLDENTSKQGDHLSTTEREIRAALESARDISTHEQQVLRDRIVSLEARQLDDDKRSRINDVNLATLREQMNNVVLTINSLHDVILANRSPSVVASPANRK